ncbi:hypothetical protein [Hyphomonas sp.]|uniref:hypothetical protein n=1 Tax=Hyphomonas sp. TaxID=87 RepID=UPI00300198C5
MGPYTAAVIVGLGVCAVLALLCICVTATLWHKRKIIERCDHEWGRWKGEYSNGSVIEKEICRKCGVSNR